MNIEFAGNLWFWKGPAPWYFVTLSDAASMDLAEVSTSVTYGWGMIPVVAHVGRSRWRTSLFPKDGGYILPVKATIRKAEGLSEGDLVTVRLDVNV